jgi:Calcineurin-like phosphoesterase
MPHQVAAYLTHWRGGPGHTLPVPPFPSRAMPRVRIAAIGDVGDSGRTEDRTAAAMAAVAAGRRFDALVLLGDNVYPAGDPSGLHATVFEPFGPVLDAGTRLFAILGNHDVLAGHQDDQLRALGMPARWWSVASATCCWSAWTPTSLTTRRSAPGWGAPWRPRPHAGGSCCCTIRRTLSGYHGSSTAVRCAFGRCSSATACSSCSPGTSTITSAPRPSTGSPTWSRAPGSGSRRTGTEDFTAAAFGTPSFLDVAVFDDHLLVRAIDQQARISTRWCSDPTRELPAHRADHRTAARCWRCSSSTRPTSPPARPVTNHGSPHAPVGARVRGYRRRR